MELKILYHWGAWVAQLVKRLPSAQPLGHPGAPTIYILFLSDLVLGISMLIAFTIYMLIILMLVSPTPSRLIELYA